jgi:phosphatidate cytidylyltransferase
MLKKRVITALWGIPLIAAVVWFGDIGDLWLFTAFIAIWGTLAVIEFYRLLHPLKIQPVYIFGILWVLAFIAEQNKFVSGYIAPYYSGSLPVITVLITAGAIVSLITLLARRQKFNAFPAWAWTWAGILYIGWLLGYAVALRGVEDGRNWVFYALFCTFGSDSAAFFMGKAIGRHKLAPSISPNKTWEGTVGGLLGAVGVSLLFLLSHPLSLATSLSIWQAVVLGLLVSVSGQLGDLVESLFKRNVGAKDSGTLIPGHGGVLDRMDSVVFAIVVVYYWVVWIL